MQQTTSTVWMIVIMVLMVPFILIAATQIIAGCYYLLYDIGSHDWHHLMYLMRLYARLYLYDTLFLVIGVLMFSFIIGTSLAYLVSYYDLKYKRFLDILCILPMAAPSYIIGYIYADLFDYFGFLHLFFLDYFSIDLGHFFKGFVSPFGAIIVLSICFYPYVYLFLRSFFINRSQCAGDAARTLGVGRIETFFKVTLPMARPHIIAGLSFVMIETLAEFGVVEYYGMQTLSVGILKAWRAHGSLEFAQILSLLLFVCVLLVIGFEEYGRRMKKSWPANCKYTCLHWHKPGFIGHLFIMIICGVFFGFSVFVPYFYLGYHSVDFWGITSDFSMPVYNTLWLGAIIAFIIVIASSIIAFSDRIKPAYRPVYQPFFDRVKKIMDYFITIGYAWPGTVLAVGCFTTFGLVQHYIIDTQILFGSIVGLCLAYYIRFSYMGYKGVQTAMNQVRPEFDDVAIIAKKNSLERARTVYAPLMKSQYFVTFFLVFIEIIKELPATLILRPFNFDTLAVKIYRLASDEKVPASSPYALILLVLGVIGAIILANRYYQTRPGHHQDEL